MLMSAAAASADPNQLAPPSTGTGNTDISMESLNASLSSLDWLKQGGNSATPNTGLSPRVESSHVGDATPTQNQSPAQSVRPQSGGSSRPSSGTKRKSPKQGGSGGHKKTGSDEAKQLTFQADGKPNLSYSELIRRAIESSATGRMTLNEIYEWVMDNFAFYSEQDQSRKNSSWKNSIRHNLSLNKMFIREQRDRKDPGKGSYWRIDETVTAGNRSPANTSTNQRTARPVTVAIQQNAEHPYHQGDRNNAPRVNPAVERLVQQYFNKDPLTIRAQQQLNVDSQMLNAPPPAHMGHSPGSSTSQISPVSLGSGGGTQSDMSMQWNTSWGSQNSFNGSLRNSNHGSNTAAPFSHCALSDSFQRLYRQALNSSASSNQHAQNNSNSNPLLLDQSMSSYQASSSEPANAQRNYNQIENLLASTDMQHFQSMVAQSGGDLTKASIRDWLQMSTTDLASSYRNFMQQTASQSDQSFAAVPLQHERPYEPDLFTAINNVPIQQASGQSGSEAPTGGLDIPDPQLFEKWLTTPSNTQSTSNPLPLPIQTMIPDQPMDIDRSMDRAAALNAQQIMASPDMADTSETPPAYFCHNGQSRIITGTRNPVMALNNGDSPMPPSMVPPSHSLPQAHGHALNGGETDEEDDFDWEKLVNRY